MRQIIVATAALVLFLSGCASRASFDDWMASFVGRGESAAIAELGVPDQNYTTGGTRALQWNRSGARYLILGTPPVGLFPGTPDRYGEHPCRIQMMVDAASGRIMSAHGVGRGCIV